MAVRLMFRCICPRKAVITAPVQRLPPTAGRLSRVLILGTMPGKVSLRVPSRFWPPLDPSPGFLSCGLNARVGPRWADDRSAAPDAVVVEAMPVGQHGGGHDALATGPQAFTGPLFDIGAIPEAVRVGPRPRWLVALCA